METWTDTYYQLLASKKEEISHSDFRFYNIGHLPLLAAKTNELSETCPECRDNLKTLELLADQLPGCLEKLNERRSWERNRDRIEKHLRKEHQVRPAHYAYASYSFWGALTGIATGLAVSFLVRERININITLLFFAIGLIIGQILGKKADKKRYRKNLQI